MSSKFKNTSTYNNLKKITDAEYDSFTCENGVIPTLVGFILSIIVCSFYLGSVWDAVYKPQETVGWFFLAVFACSMFMIVLFIISFIIGTVINHILAFIFFTIKFKASLGETSNQKRMIREKREYMDNLFANFTHFHPSYWLLEKNKQQFKENNNG